MQNFLDIHKVLFQVWGYDVSYIEFFGLISGIIAVILAAFANLWNWPVGIINVVLSFFLFYQVQLYPDMFLQVFFFVTNIIGWWRWTHPKPFEEDIKHELKVSFMKKEQLMLVVLVGLLGTLLLGFLAKNLHEIVPSIFPKPSASPFLDSFITVMSVVTTFYMIEKKIECWVIWILVDIMATYLYYIRDIKLYALLYLILTMIAIYALWNWIKEYKNYQGQPV